MPGFKYNPCVGSRPSEYQGSEAWWEFKYNPCVGSSYSPKVVFYPFKDLNTTLVSVQVSISIRTPMTVVDLNTTLVSVQVLLSLTPH